MSTQPEAADDLAITLNIITSITIGSIVVILFCLIRTKLKWLYSPNVNGRTRHPAFYNNGHFNWIWTTLAMSDKKLLTFVGLDAFTLVQTMKLLSFILTASAVIALGILLPVYSSGTIQKETIRKLSLSNVPSGSSQLWAPFVVCYLITFVAFYLLSIFFRKYDLIKQAYVRDSSSVTSLLELAELRDLKGSVLEARSSLNFRHRSVLLRNIPQGIVTNADLKKFVQGFAIGKVETAFLVKQPGEFGALIEKRKHLVDRLEGAFNKFIHSVNTLNEEEKRLVFKSSTNQEQYNDEEKREILKRFVQPHFQKKYKPVLKKGRIFRKEKTDCISETLNELNQVEEALFELFKANHETFLYEFNGNADTTEDVTIPLSPKEPDFDIYKYGEKNVELMANCSFWNPFMSKRIITTGSRQVSNSGFVTFVDPISASILNQCIVESRLFGTEVIPAPHPDQVMWKNLGLTNQEKSARIVSGSLLFIAFTVFFSVLVLALALVLSLDTLVQYIPGLEGLVQNQTLKSTLEGVLAPLALNILLALTPPFLSSVSRYQGFPTIAMIEVETMSKFYWFLFINLFLAVLISLPFKDLIDHASAGEYGVLFEDLATSFGKKAVFFINLLIQRALIGNSLGLINPAGVIFSLVGKLLSPKSPRAIKEKRKGQKTNYFLEYPMHILIFTIGITFSTSSPLVLVPTAMFFVFGYFTHKYKMIYSNHTSYESGGQDWVLNSSHIIFSISVCQFATFAQLVIKEGFIQVALLLPVFVITALMKRKLQKMYRANSNCLALNQNNEPKIDSYTSSFVHRQDAVLEDWTQESKTIRKEDVGFEMLIDGFEAEKKEFNADATYPYAEPYMKYAEFIMLPDSFFRIISSLKSDEAV